MAADDRKRSREVRCGALMIAAAATFLLMTGCDSMQSRPCQPSTSRERHEDHDLDESYHIWHGGHAGRSGVPIYGGGMTSAPDEGSVRGGFGKTGAMHASGS